MKTNSEFPRPQNELYPALGYTFKDSGLLTLALTHSSYANELRTKMENPQCNERLEFFGDSILSFIVSNYIYHHYAEDQEGDLTKIRAAVVCEKALAKYARAIHLGEFLLLGKGEDAQQGRTRASLTSDAFEAVLAAMFLDAKSLEPVSKFLLPFVKAEIAVIQETSSFVDYKTALQQIVQEEEHEKFEYVLVDESGPAHDKRFSVEARLNSNVIGRGTARSKRAAEQLAAKEALALFGGNNGK